MANKYFNPHFPSLYIQSLKPNTLPYYLSIYIMYMHEVFLFKHDGSFEKFGKKKLLVENSVAPRSN